MNTLKRAWATTSKPWFFYTVMSLCSLVIAYSWYVVGQHVDLHQIREDIHYKLGVMAAMTAVVMGAFLGITASHAVRRYGPAKALPVDPDFPPTKVVYIEGDGAPERCACHGTVIEDGTTVWHWPRPAVLVCVRKGHAR
jgi:hypothetical protein